MSRAAVPCAVIAAILAACAGSTPVDPGVEGPRGSGPFGLQDGPHASVDAIPLPDANRFEAAAPTRLVLSNGLNVLLQQDTTRPVVEVRVYLDAGSWDDPRGLTGVAEMAGRVIREGGGETWAGPALDEELAHLGASLTVSVGDTGTTVRVHGLAEDFARVLGMLEDVVRAPTFPEETLERVRARMRADIVARDDSSSAQADREGLRAYYGVDDPRARRLELADLDAITREDLVAFHRRHIGSRRALLAVLGDVAADQVETELDRRFGDWGGQIADAREQLPQPQPPDSRRVLSIDRADVNQAEIRLLYPGVDLAHPDRGALMLGSYVLGAGGFGSRMMQRVRVELGLAYGVGARWRAPAGRDGLFRAATATRSESFGTTLGEMLAVTDDLLQQGIGEQEFAAARARWFQSQVFRVDTPGEVLWRIAELERHGLPWDFDAKANEAMRALTREEVLEACRRHLDPQRLLVFVVGDRAAFDRPPSDFGDASTWEDQLVGSGNGDRGAGNAAATELAARLLAQHGGAEVWSVLEAIAVEADLGSGPVRVLMVTPDRMAWQYVSDEAPFLVFAGDRAWEPGAMHGPGKVEALSAVCQAELPILLMRLARGELRLESPAEGVLVAVGPTGHRVRLDVGPDGLVQSITTERQVQEFSDYALRGGVMLPGFLEQSDDGQPALGTELRNWEVAPEVPGALFEPPTE